MSAEFLATSLEESGIQWKVIMVSACFAGGFIPHLENEHTLILTAADAENTSFGCSDDSDMTYFGKALFKEVLTENPDLPFAQAFIQAKEIIGRWEDQEALTPSNPQIHQPEKVLHYLDRWRAHQK